MKYIFVFGLVALVVFMLNTEVRSQTRSSPGDDSSSPSDDSSLPPDDSTSPSNNSGSSFGGSTQSESGKKGLQKIPNDVKNQVTRILVVQGSNDEPDSGAYESTDNNAGSR